MKGILCACLLSAFLSTNQVQAYEADIHYSTTYVLARAVGWSPADALTIASANQGVDENQDTVAALEMDATSHAVVAGFIMSSLRQAEKNLRFHCFSSNHGKAGRISPDVLEVISGHFAAVPEPHEDPQRSARRSIALGVALHCQQDAYAHVDFGGTCGSYPGSCYGHTHQTFLDQVAFRLLGRHYHNPDHPGVSGEWLLEALQGTARELAARRPAAFPVPTPALVALSDALRASGLELPDEVRLDCNRHIAGKWLFDFLRTRDKRKGSPGAAEKLAPEVAGTCRNASLASANVVRIPEPRFPRLNPDGSPHFVGADGTYAVLRKGGFDAALAVIADQDYGRKKVQLSHWTQLLGLPPSGSASAFANRFTVGSAIHSPKSTP
jgi:hypothetical protein